MRKPVIITASIALTALAIGAVAGSIGANADDGSDGSARANVRSESPIQRSVDPSASPTASSDKSSQKPQEGQQGKKEKKEQFAPPAAGSTLNAVTHPELGPLVVDAQGFTLYRFDEDTAKPSKSNCNGPCAVAWPPAMSPVNWKDVTLSGVPRENVSFVERADGTCQLTIAGWPVYRFAKDTKPGDVNGQGVNGTWFAVRPDGKKAGAETSTDTPSPQPSASASTPPANGSGSSNSGYRY